MKTTKSLTGTTLLVLTSLLRETVAHDNCTFCTDGSDLKEKFIDEGMCNFINMYLDSNQPIDPHSIDCKSNQLYGFHGCGCDTYPVIDDACTTCADGTLISDDFRDVQISPDEPAPTCIDIEAKMSIINKSAGRCPHMQQIGYYHCGCTTLPSPVQDPCQFCPDSYILQNNDRLMDDELQLTCEQRYKGASIVPATSDQCDEIKVDAIDYECCRAPEEKKVLPLPPTPQQEKGLTLTPTPGQKKGKKGNKDKKNKKGKKKNFKRL